jgi:hypothetical protein
MRQPKRSLRANSDAYQTAVDRTPTSAGAAPYLLLALEALTNLVDLKKKTDKLERERTSAASYRVAPSPECLRQLEVCYRKQSTAWKKSQNSDAPGESLIVSTPATIE